MGVVTNLEPVVVQPLDLFPGHEGLFVSLEFETFRNEKCRPETKLLEDRGDGHGVGNGGIIKGQHDQLVGDFAKASKR